MTWRKKLGAMIAGEPMALWTGGFEGSQRSGRLRKFMPARAHVNTLIAAAGPDMNARARWLVRNNGYAANAIESWAGNAVGDGIKPVLKLRDRAVKEELQRLWLSWTDEADSEGITDFYGLQRRAAREVFMCGEVFIRFRPRRAEDGLRVPLQLQLLPSEMLPMNLTQVAANGNRIRQGIEFDRLGRRQAYHFYRRHPGDVTEQEFSGEITRVPASEVLHIIDPVEAGQLRGVSKFAPAIVKLFLLDQYDDAELDRKKIAAMFAIFITTPAAENPLAPAEDDNEIELSPGLVTRLDAGEEVTVGQPADSGGTYEPFQYRTLLQVSAALGIPYPYLTNDMVKGNFSNSRLALIEFRRRVAAWQHGVMVYQMCRPVFERWLDVVDFSDAITLPNYQSQRALYQRADWLPTKWDWVDPLKDANAELAQIEGGLKSRTQAIAERGYDAEEVDREIAEERARERELGLDFRRPGSPQGAAPSTGATPGSVPGREDESDSDDEEDDTDAPRRADEE
jgi:lambda family phage portal protein